MLLLLKVSAVSLVFCNFCLLRSHTRREWHEYCGKLSISNSFGKSSDIDETPLHCGSLNVAVFHIGIPH